MAMERNTIIFNGAKTDTFVEKSSLRIIYLLGRQKKQKYKDNPPVAAIVNGELKSLQSEIPENGVIDLVPLHSPAGRNVYRRTLCFLLEYASSIVYPERTLIVGHSLGDGFYFSYRNKEQADVEKLKAVMQKAIEDDLTVDIVTLSAKQALDYAREARLEETEKLFLTRNEGAYDFNCIGTCKSVYHEPMLPSLRFLEVWDLMEYQGGLLLRYPQSRCPDRILEFADNPLLFNVFAETKNQAKILDLESLGALNMKQSNGLTSETIILSETLLRRRISRTALKIRDKKTVKIVFIAGPTSSGKKTCGVKLCAELKTLGYHPFMLSLDDYKRKVDVEGDGVFKDVLDTELLRSQIKDLLDGKEVILSNLSNTNPHMAFRRSKAQMEENAIIVLEGIQTLGEGDLIPDLPEKSIFRVFVSALTSLNIDTTARISTTDNRLLRRLVKECRTSSVTPAEILNAWPQIESEEKNLLFPFQNNADDMVNSALEYEFGVLYSYALPLLRLVRPEDGNAYTTAKKLMAFLELVYPIPSELVPSESILREFIGGSAYQLN